MADEVKEKAGGEKVREQRPIDVLRQRMGGVSDELKEYFKEQNRIRKLLSEAFGQGARTVPELAQATKLEPHVVLWHVMAMKKYGRVAEVEPKGDYFTYAMTGKE